MKKGKQIFAGLLLVAVAFSSNAIAQKKGGDNVLTKKEKKQGWQLLFDGSTTNGWHSFNEPTLGTAWKAADGALHLTKKGEGETAGDAVSAEEYGDFHLKLEWKISPNGNSGIMFLAKEDPKYKYAYYTGPEMQVLDNNGHPDAKIQKHRAGDLYDLITSVPENVKPVGEWNSVEIKLEKGKLELWQNGINVVSTTLWDDHWKQMVAGSKFKSLEDFAKFKTGHIVLQDHGDEVWYKNIKIKKLD
ncbi:MAG: 3-keto-disaccharide hydrolase [Agriterribacter sp.]